MKPLRVLAALAYLALATVTWSSFIALMIRIRARRRERPEYWPSNEPWPAPDGPICGHTDSKPPTYALCSGRSVHGTTRLDDFDDGALPSKPEKWNHYTLGKGDASHYAVLGVARDATAQQIKRAYRKQTKTCHPDVDPSDEGRARFHQVTFAYETLRDDRGAYDGALQVKELQWFCSMLRRLNPGLCESNWVLASWLAKLRRANETIRHKLTGAATLLASTLATIKKKIGRACRMAERRASQAKPDDWPYDEPWPPLDGPIMMTLLSDPPIYVLRSGRWVYGVTPETNEALRTSATRRWTAIMRKYRAIPKHLRLSTIRQLATTRVEAGDLPRNETEVFDQWLFEQLRRTEELRLWPVDDDTVDDTVAVRAPAGPLGVFFFGHRVTEVRSWSPLAGQVAVEDRLVSIDAPGRALFTCAGRNVTGLDIIHELRAGAASDGRVLTFGREYRAGRS